MGEVGVSIASEPPRNEWRFIAGKLTETHKCGDFPNHI